MFSKISWKFLVAIKYEMQVNHNHKLSHLAALFCRVRMGRERVLFQWFSFLILLFVFRTQNLGSSCKENEKNALLKFKENLVDPWKRLSSWEGKDCCRWSGVTCSNRTRNIMRLDLGNRYSGSGVDGYGEENKLSGEIDSSLLELRYLSHLDLSMNNFQGAEIPNFFGSFTRLRYLNLSGASWGGRIPQNLGNLSGLEYLDLSSSNYESLESDVRWISGLFSLKYLNLGGTDLGEGTSDWLETVGILPSLLELHLPRCQLSSFPHYLPSTNLTSLLVLDLSSNGFTSIIPKWLFNLTSLKSLDLSSNGLYGVIPQELSGLTTLQNLDMSSNNGIGGPLPQGLGVLCDLQKFSLAQNNLNGEIVEFVDHLSDCNNSRLETLNLGYNKLTGILPESFGLLRNLRIIYLWYNSFTGSIPSTIGNLSSLSVLSLSNNTMSGKIPESFGQLVSLVVMDLYKNSWEGVITEAHFANLSSLEEISIGRFSPDASLAFSISSEWMPLFNLKYVKIQGCQLGPKFPTWLRNQSDLKTVVINYAKISDVIPDWFFEMGLRLKELDVAYNQLTGRVPNSLQFISNSNVDLSSNSFEGYLPRWSSNLSSLYLRDNNFFGPIPRNIGTALPLLKDLDISINNLNGTIPSSLANLAGLMTLIVSNNQLHGEIPGFWANMPMLYIVDMSKNSLHGNIPDSIGFLANLRFFILSSNNLSGSLPSRLRNCTQLSSLDLGDNNLSGGLPAWIGDNMASLLILSVRNNTFTGNIPSQLCKLSVLHILDVSKNNLSGKIPSCLGNLSGFKRDLVHQDTELYEGSLQVISKGKLLLFKTILYLVNSIDMSNNNLSGEIPVEITTLFRLGTLNLSMNCLTGKIPSDIQNLERIETLDLSKNLLSGPIPPSMAALTFLNHLNLSYNNLSGRIPTSNQFLTLNDPSIYEGNMFLCGIPLSAECDEHPSSPFPGEDGGDANDNDNDNLEKLLLFAFIALGYLIGFWGVCGSLIINKRWRDAYFGFAARIMSTIIGLVLRCRLKHDIGRT